GSGGGACCGRARNRGRGSATAAAAAAPNVDRNARRSDIGPPGKRLRNAAADSMPLQARGTIEGGAAGACAKAAGALWWRHSFLLGRWETGMKRRAVVWFLCLSAAGLLTAGAQERQTSRQAVEKRLRDVQKEKSSLSVEKAIEALA